MTLEYQVPAATAPVAVPPDAPPPDTEIFLASCAATNGQLHVGAPINITNSPGYDNQPSFTPDGREILFTSGARHPEGASASAAGFDAA